MKRNLMLLLAVLITAVMLCPMSVAMTTDNVFTPTVDTWIRASGPTSSYDNDRLCVWMSPDSSGDVRQSILQFDVSGMSEPIAAAYLDLYLTNYWRNSANSAVQMAELITPSVPGGSVTWSDIYSGAYTGIAMESFGYYAQDAGTATDQYYSSGTASAADLAAMNAQKDATGILTFLLKPAEPAIVGYETVYQGRHDWGDNVYGGAAQISVNDAASLSPVADVWVRGATGGTYENDAISVWFNERTVDGVGDGERVGIVEFDLTDQADPITSLQMSLFSLSSSVSGEAFLQEAYLLTLPTGMALTDINWSTFTTLAATPLETLGRYEFEGGAANAAYENTWVASDASANDIAALEAIRQGDGRAVIAFRAVMQEVDGEVPIYGIGGGQREWGDTGYDAARPEMWPHLVLTAVPEPSTIFLILSALASLMIVRKK